MHPFHILKVQSLFQVDYGPQVQFCNWVLEREAQQPQFFFQVLFTDEACFTREGIVLNQRNSHVWEYVNPHITVGKSFQHTFRVNIWADMISNYLIGPYLLLPWLNGHVYREFLVHVLPSCWKKSHFTTNIECGSSMTEHLLTSNWILDIISITCFLNVGLVVVQILLDLHVLQISLP